MPSKTEIKTEQVEIVRQVRLTTSQRMELVEMSNKGGRDRNIDWRVRHDLTALGLIEERDQFTPVEKVKIRQEIDALWKQAAGQVKAKDVELLKRTADSIREKRGDLERKAFWLTAAANEYLVKGRVLITR